MDKFTRQLLEKAYKEDPRWPCPTCKQLVVPRLRMETETTGAVGVPLPNHLTLFRPIQESHLTASCPLCGGWMYHPEVEKDEISNRRWKIGLGIFFTLLALGVLYLNLAVNRPDILRDLGIPTLP